MRLSLFSLALGLAQQAVAAGVVGSAEGFAKGVTGGGSATPVYPSTIAELTSYLADDKARVIMLNKEFNFLKSEGTATEKGCRPASNKCPGNGGQDAINHASWCDNGNAGAGSTSITVTYDKAGVSGLTVGSNKSIVGVGSKGVIRGKGLRLANGAKNVIIQNIHITELNPQYIWGGDGITLDGTDLVWTALPSPTASLTVPPTGLPLVTATTTGLCTSLVPLTWSPSRVTTSTTPLAAPPRSVATPSSMPSTTTGTPTLATPSMLVRPTPTSSSRATSSRTSSPLCLRTRARSSPPALSAPPAPAASVVLARPTLSAPLEPSAAPRLPSSPTSRARTLPPPLPPTLPSAPRLVLASLLKRLS
ncbi:Pectate lyase/Amb allergen [Macrophomina phaseolina MS6]|uniref:pectin lyase n=1 Tax=Macrophomina phaseolina (strain MS6) TaxID=1126212 RepID=K2S2X8_MACPH|nr:Pectate lyase/Amb allergen [Macrophomina phaseolina MS6]